MSETKPSPSPVPAPSKSMPWIAAAVALVALAVVVGLLRLRRDGQTEVVEERVVLPTVAAQTPAVAPQPAAAPAVVPAATSSTAPAAAVSKGPHAEPAVGDVFEGTVNGLGTRGDGRLRVRGRTVYVSGAREGESLRFRITRDTGNVLFGERVASTVPLTELTPEVKETVAPVAAVAPATDLPAGVLDGAVASADAVKPGVEFSVVITDKDRFNPEKNGVTRIGGFVVIIADAQPGPDRVRIRITERLERRANAEKVK